MNYDLIKTGDSDVFPQIQDRNGEVCLSYCRVCRKGEGELDIICEGPTIATIKGTSLTPEEVARATIKNSGLYNNFSIITDPEFENHKACGYFKRSLEDIENSLSPVALNSAWFWFKEGWETVKRCL